MKWSSLVSQHESVNVAHAIRNEDTDVLHFAQDGKEFLAIKSKTPYGVLDDLSSGEHVMPPFFKRVSSGEDFTVLSLPHEIMPLSAIVRGTGQNKAESLQSTFTQVGRVIRDVVEQAQTPELTIDEFAVSKTSGEVYLMPPIDFAELSDLNLTRQEEGMHQSLSTVGRFSGSAIARLTLSLNEGLQGYGRA